jgi:hypothetical protein
MSKYMKAKTAAAILKGELSNTKAHYSIALRDAERYERAGGGAVADPAAVEDALGRVTEGYEQALNALAVLRKMGKNPRKEAARMGVEVVLTEEPEETEEDAPF